MKLSRLLFSILSISIIASCCFATTAVAIGEQILLNVDKNYDATGRDQVQATLVRTGQNLNFYVDTAWWIAQSSTRQSDIGKTLDNLSVEFDSAIYPKLTSVFGSEWRPGVDNDTHMTILFEPLKGNNAGYFRQNDEYQKLQVPDSNEREMMYLSTSTIDSFYQLKTVLAHEFMHLIIFNQKNRLQGAQEETWLDELRSDYTSTLLGYDDQYQGSNLQSRVQDFIENPSNPLLEWQNLPQDFAAAHLFGAYLVDHYGLGILSNSLHSKLVGIASLNEALAKINAPEDFGKAFTNWTVALVINDCLANKNYCYVNQNLKTLRINPTLNFLPLTGNSSLAVTNVTKNWTGNWQKIIGGNGNLTLQFSGSAETNFQVPYLIFDKTGNYTVNSFKLDKNQKGQISVPRFGSDYSSVIVMPSLQNKTAFAGYELPYQYTITASVTAQQQDDQALIQQLLAQIESLKQQIAAIQGNTGGGQNTACRALTANLYVGVKNTSQVQCLQQFLKNQGTSVYPEGIVTGFFGQLTKAAVMRFQNIYNIPATGFVGTLTRAKINELL